jgi:hypothetical protein
VTLVCLACFKSPIGRFIPLNPRDGAELAFPAFLLLGLGTVFEEVL